MKQNNGSSKAIVLRVKGKLIDRNMQEPYRDERGWIRQNYVAMHEHYGKWGYD